MNGLSQVYSKCSLFHKEPYTKHFWTLIAFFSLEAYLASLYFILLPFSVIAFFFFLNKWKVCGNPTLNKSFGVVFPTAFVHLHVSVSHLLILTVFQTFS